MKNKIYFRADASAEIGYGHFIRTLALADMLKSEFSCTFFTVEPTEYQLVEIANVCKCESMNGNNPLDDFLKFLQGDEIVVLDNYFYTSDYQKKIKDKGCKLVLIDDMHNMHYYADVIINNSLEDSILYDAEPYSKFCIGRGWLLLRSEFFKKTISNVKRNTDLIICFGGADPYHITNKFLEYINPASYNGIIHVIAGDKVYIDNKYTSMIVVHRNISASQIVELFDKSMLAIVSSSTIHIEAMTRGIHLLVGYYVDNQKEDYDYGIKNNNFIGLGNLLEYDGHDIKVKMNAAKSINYRVKVSNIQQNFINMFKSLD